MLNQLIVAGLHKKIGFKTILEDINLTAEAGELLVVTGPNGAGKTTLLRILAGLAPLSSGEILWDGELFLPKKVEHLKQIGILGHRPMVYGSLTALENLMFFGKMYGVKGSRVRIEEMLRWVGLHHYKHERVENFSRGMQQRLALARMLLHAPALLLYDEPFTGLDAEGQRLLTGTLKMMQEEGRVQILISHKLDELSGLSYREVRLAGGRLALDVENELAAGDAGEEVSLPAFVRLMQGSASKVTAEVDWPAKKTVANAASEVVLAADDDTCMLAAKAVGEAASGLAGRDASDILMIEETEESAPAGDGASIAVDEVANGFGEQEDTAEADGPLDLKLAAEAWKLACDRAESISAQDLTEVPPVEDAQTGVGNSLTGRIKGIFAQVLKLFTPDLPGEAADGLPEGGITVEEFLKSAEITGDQSSGNVKEPKSLLDPQFAKDLDKLPRLHENAVITRRFTGNPLLKKEFSQKQSKAGRSRSKLRKNPDNPDGKRDKS